MQKMMNININTDNVTVLFVFITISIILYSSLHFNLSDMFIFSSESGDLKDVWTLRITSLLP